MGPDGRRRPSRIAGARGLRPDHAAHERVSDARATTRSACGALCRRARRGGCPAIAPEAAAVHAHCRVHGDRHADVDRGGGVPRRAGAGFCARCAAEPRGGTRLLARAHRARDDRRGPGARLAGCPAADETNEPVACGGVRGSGYHAACICSRSPGRTRGVAICVLVAAAGAAVLALEMAGDGLDGAPIQGNPHPSWYSAPSSSSRSSAQRSRSRTPAPSGCAAQHGGPRPPAPNPSKTTSSRSRRPSRLGWSCRSWEHPWPSHCRSRFTSWPSCSQ